MAWTLEHVATSTTQTLTEWGADESASLTLMSQAVSYLTLHFPGMLDADVPFAFKDKIILRNGSTVVFRGIAMDPQRTGSGNEEGITIQFADAWWYLGNGTITQTVYDGSTVAGARTCSLGASSANVIVSSLTGIAVGMYVNGTGIPVNATVVSLGSGYFTISAPATVTGDQTLNFARGTAQSRRALFALLYLGRLSNAYDHISVGTELSNIIAACDLDHGGGVIAFGAASGPAYSIQPQPIDIQGTFETALRAAIQFAPDTITYFDYTTDPPQLHFVQRASAATKTLAYADGTLHIDQDIKARHDLVINGVRIIYNYYQPDGTPATAVDEAGATTGPNVLQVQFDLRAPTQSPQDVPAVVESQTLKTVSSDISDPAWWKTYAQLKADVADIGVADGTVLELDPDAPENDGAEGSPGGCTRMILEGNIPAWLNQDSHLKYVRAVGVLFIKTYNDPSDHSKGYSRNLLSLDLCFAATDLTTNEYTNTVSAAHTDGGTFDPEHVPGGIAAAILAAQGTLQYQGAITLTNDECDFSFVPGKVLNITGSRAEWTAMNAQIQGVQHQIQTGTTSLTLGPAQHLAPQDYLELARRMQVLKPALNLDSRAVGSTAEGSGKVNHPQTQLRTGVRIAINCQEEVATGSSSSGSQWKRNTDNGQLIVTNGTVTVALDCSSNLVSIVSSAGAGKTVNIDLDDLPDGAVAQFRDAYFCDSSGSPLTAKVLMTAPAAP